MRDDSQQAIEQGARAALDTLVARIAGTTASLREDTRTRLDRYMVHGVTADVALVAGLLRSLNAAARARLQAAVDDLQHAREELSRSPGSALPPP